jgi:hypothetical protein
MTRYWLDTEFIEDGRTIDLISIGIVCEDGRELYAISIEFDESKANEWVKDNVISKLEPKDLDKPTISRLWKSRQDIKNQILEFIEASNDNAPEFWGYYADYDWVVLCQLFGTMMDLPESFPFYCRDIKQWCDQLGNPKLPEQGEGEHNALADARWNKLAWDFLNKYSEDCVVERVS